jgi:adenylate cyclase class 2
MTLEIEVKAYADNLAKVEERLKELGAVFISEVADEQSFLTYKGRKIDAKSKTREEIEVVVSDADSANLILLRLGFEPVAEVSKVRKRYKIDEFEICLDDVEGVGPFVEVETKGDNMAELRDKALAILEKLNLRKTERKSYLELQLELSSGS